MNRTLCGVDISKDWLDAGVAPVAAEGRFRNDAAGIAELAAFCRAQGVDLVVMEASGGYERLAFLLLWQLGIACVARKAQRSSGQTRQSQPTCVNPTLNRRPFAT